MAMKKTSPSNFTEISAEELDGLTARLEEAVAYDLTLTQEDIVLLLKAVKTLVAMQSRLSDKDVTVHKLRKLVGMVQSSEKLSHLLGEDNRGKKKKRKPKRNPPSDKKGGNKKALPARKQFHAHQSLQKGQRCPECESGTLYKYEPAQLLRITGHTPYTPELHVSERLRCNACGQFFTAELSSEVLADGSPNQKYGYSARSLMALNKYFAGAPFYRQESLQELLGQPISASTVFDQCELLANDLLPIFNTLSLLAADAQHFHLDDTTHRILDQTSVEKKKRNSDKMQTRTGLYASGIIASVEQHDIILFQTNIGYAGEFLDQLLEKRQPDRPPPIVMCDALSSNTPTATDVLLAGCNSHARRQFVDVINPFPDQVEWVLERYARIWDHDEMALAQAMTPQQRLVYHQEHSLPIMEEIRQWVTGNLNSGEVEANSSLGKAMAYFDRHFDRLTLFCQVEGAKIDNNYMESMLKLIVRNRKNAYFYKTLTGAAISDVITSCIATTMKTGINVFEYFNALQRNAQSVKGAPMAWLPWNWQPAES